MSRSPPRRDVQSPRESGTHKSINIEIFEPTHAATPKLKTPSTPEISTHKEPIGSRIKNCTDQAHLGNACLTVFRRSPVDGAAHDVMPFRPGLPPASCPSAVHHKCSASSSELAHHWRDFCHLRPVCFRFVAMARHLQRASQPASQPAWPARPATQPFSKPASQPASQPGHTSHPASQLKSRSPCIQPWRQAATYTLSLERVAWKFSSNSLQRKRIRCSLPPGLNAWPPGL